VLKGLSSFHDIILMDNEVQVHVYQSCSL